MSNISKNNLQNIKFNRLSEPDKILLGSLIGLKKYNHKKGCYYKSVIGYYYFFDFHIDGIVFCYYDNIIYTKLKSYFTNMEYLIDDCVKYFISKKFKNILLYNSIVFIGHCNIKDKIK